MKNLIFALSCIGVSAFAKPVELKFKEAKSPAEVFSVKEVGQALIQHGAVPFSEWKEKQSGRYFPMEVAPVLAGLVAGGVTLPPPQLVDSSKYQDQAKEFAEVINIRNQGGRPGPAPSTVPPAKRYADEQKNTYVVQLLLASVIPRPFGQLKLTSENFASIIENADLDHYHFRIPGSLVLQALESNHIAAKSVQPEAAYVLSVVDFREYSCAAMKDGLRDYFSKGDKTKKLMNESIYMISDLNLNAPEDLVAAEKMFGKRPDAVLGQRVIFADHLIRGARTLFVFFAEGANTRVVSLSNLAMQSQHFTGVKGGFASGMIMNGINGSWAGSAAIVKDQFKDLLGSATQDVRNKNACDRGLAKGLIRYSQDLFGEFLGAL